MAPAPFLPFLFLHLIRFVLLVPGIADRNPSCWLATAAEVEGLDRGGEFSILSYDSFSWHDYSPPSPPPPASPVPPSCSCEADLGGAGDFDTVCEVRSSVQLSEDIYMTGSGSLVFLAGVILSCPVAGCSIIGNLSGDVRLGQNSGIIAGTVKLVAANMTILERAVLNTTALAGAPPPQTSGRPSGTNGDGGGHGGRGASCVVKEGQTQEDSWGGDAYSWSSLDQPDSYGSRGGTTSREEDYGGGGGGRVWLLVEDLLEVDGIISADGGDGGRKGGGGSGGSIYIKASKMYSHRNINFKPVIEFFILSNSLLKNRKGSGKISASGGSGLAGGGGGRVSIDVFSRHDDPQVCVHGGRSFGCLENSGAAGTFYDAVPKSLFVNNHNFSTETDTLLLEFPNQPLWTNVFVKNCAKVVVPLLWSRVQVQGQLSLFCGAVLTFGLTHYPYSEFELMAEELLMSESIIKVFGALRMSVKMLLMWNSRMLINGGGDTIVATSLLEASNLIVLKESSMIQSNANLGVHGQGLLNLSGPGDLIEAQRLILSLFYSIHVGPGSVLRGPLINATKDDMAPRLNCEVQNCPMELIHPPEDCNVNSSLSFTLQICRVEDIDVEGLIQGTVIHFHRARSVVVHSSGKISATGLGCKGGVGRGKISSSGLGGGGGHGGKGGDGFCNGTFVEGGIAYGNADLPCELGSGSGNDSITISTGGGGIIVMGSLEHSLSSLSVHGSVEADGESSWDVVGHNDATINASNGGPGGGSGGTILLFLHTLTLHVTSVLSSVGGHGSHNGGGGGGGGRIHFHWSNIPTGDEYLPVAVVKGNINARGGMGRGEGFAGENGTITGKACPKGLYGIFCKECPLGTFKNVTGSDKSLCHQCPSDELPRRAVYISVRGGVAETPCPYKCISERYHMPHCYTALEELIYTFGGPWLFGLLLSGLLVLLALVLSVARMKFVGTDELPGPAPTQHGSQIDHSFPFLESLNEECPLGTFKNVTGSDKSLCHQCPSDELPRRAVYISVRGGVAETPCPYKCISERYHMPHCYTALEELIYTFGGPWLFGLLLSGLLVLLALVLSVARMKFVGTDELPGPAPTQHGSQIDHSFPFLESLNEVLETNRVEESQSHVHRMYFMGPNTFSEPWHLPHSPPEQIIEIVYEDAFNRFVDEINALAAYQWWEGSIHSILCILAYPLAWSWQQWRRRKKLQRLREFVRSEYDHACLRSCRSRALYEGLKLEYVNQESIYPEFQFHAVGMVQTLC
ncbi:hypothetical protein COCNU_03G015580 [Cocos nucifera]|uniref:DUF8003 domain-containing protein n=1 Tax=Cocos nucifera TaxID=13894 RepID=A0A8K0I4T5_COCNU|nr:hypothetical protein COCNU_03G015580 [Cocos nucifera]